MVLVTVIVGYAIRTFFTFIIVMSLWNMLFWFRASLKYLLSSDVAERLSETEPTKTELTRNRKPLIYRTETEPNIVGSVRFCVGSVGFGLYGFGVCFCRFWVEPNQTETENR